MIAESEVSVAEKQVILIQPKYETIINHNREVSVAEKQVILIQLGLTPQEIAGSQFQLLRNKLY